MLDVVINSEEVCSTCKYRNLCEAGYWDDDDFCPLQWEDLLPWDID